MVPVLRQRSTSEVQRGDPHTSSSVGLAFPRSHLVLELVVLVVLVVMDVRRLEETRQFWDPICLAIWVMVAAFQQVGKVSLSLSLTMVAQSGTSHILSRRVPGQPKVQQSWNMLWDVMHQDESRIGHDAFHPPAGIEAAALPAGMPREGTHCICQRCRVSFWVLRRG